MKKRVVLFVVLLLLLLLGTGQACVGKTLLVGVVNSPGEVLFAEMISVLVNERTGTTVKIVAFKDAGEMYGAVKKGEVGVVVEQAGRALKVLDRPAERSAKAAYDTAKKEYRKSLNLVWLEPFGESQYLSPVLSVDTIGNLPALPRLIGKLAGIVNDQSYGKLLKSVQKDAKPKQVARDFLKGRKLI